MWKILIVLFSLILQLSTYALVSIVTRPVEFHEPVYGNFMDEIGLIINNNSEFSSFKSNLFLREIYRVFFAATLTSSEIDWRHIVEYIIFNHHQCKLSVNNCIGHFMSLSAQDHSIGQPHEFLISSKDFTIKSTALTIRYFFDSTIIETIFNTDFSGFNVIEIGGGYGGMAITMSTLSSLASYTIVDLDIVLQLQRKYLTAVNHGFPVKGITTDSSKNMTSDLLISIFCIAEQRRDIVQKYINQYAAHAQRGYFQLNYGAVYAAGLGLLTEMEIFEMVYKVQPSAVMLPPIKSLGSLGSYTRVIWGGSFSIT